MDLTGAAAAEVKRPTGEASYTCLLRSHGSTSRLQNVGAAWEQMQTGVSSAHDRRFSQQPTEAVQYW